MLLSMSVAMAVATEVTIDQDVAMAIDPFYETGSLTFETGAIDYFVNGGGVEPATSDIWSDTGYIYCHPLKDSCMWNFNEVDGPDCVWGSSFAVPSQNPDYSFTTTVCVRDMDTNKDYKLTMVGIVDNAVTFEYEEFVPNADITINSISPSSRVELTNGETQIYTADVNDSDGDASYSWTLGGIEVSTSETYLADWSSIEPGIYTLTLNVSDAEYSDTASTTLEIRARGGSPTSTGFSGIQQEDEEQEEQDEVDYQVTADQADKGLAKLVSNVGRFFSNIGSWFGGLFR